MRQFPRREKPQLAMHEENNPLQAKRSRTPMRIGINCVQVDPFSVGGVNTYTLGLLEGFANAGNGHQFQVYASQANQHLFGQFRKLKNFDVLVVDDRLLDAKRRTCRAALLSWSKGVYKFTSNFLFEDIRKLADAESDILYTPTTVLQWFNNRKPTVVSMHDIQQVHHPEFFSWSRRLSRKITYGLSARHANYLQASSQFIKEDLLAHFRELSPEQVEVITSGVTIERFATPSAMDNLRDRYGLPERFLFFPAQLWPHKNHITVLRALKQIETKNGLKIPLVLTGGRFTAAPKIFEFIADQSMGYVLYLGKISSEDMVALYQKAAFMITATLHESSSLPILEAAAAGTPIIASKIPPLEELAEALQLNLFDPLDVDGLARLIFDLWNDEKTVSAQAAANRQQIALYSWENTASKYLRFFEKILSS
jgi:glycosyltransferase involved in cell wall biosynthesis